MQNRESNAWGGAVGAALATLLCWLSAWPVEATDAEAFAAAAAAQAYRANGEAVSPAPDGSIFCEAEEFEIEKAGWEAQPWGENYYAATFANSFLSRKAFLGAPEDCDETVAGINVEVKEAGTYLVLARYEAAFRFETRFTVRIEQSGKTALDRLYGSRKNLKIWAFGSKLKDEVAWPWGAVENVVWEGHDVRVNLQPGPARITVVAGRQPAPQAKRNLDLILLTRDEEQVNMRIEKERYLPLDGMLTQAGDVYMKIANPGPAAATVKSLSFPAGPMQQHSPYWVHLRNWKPIAVDVAPGQTTDWIEVGGTMDTLNDGQWGFHSSAPCALEFGVRDAAGQIESVRTFHADGALPLVSWADARYTHKFQTQAEATADLFNYLRGLPVPDTQLRHTLVVGSGDLPKAFYEFYGLNGVHMQGAKGYADWRGKNAAQLEEACRALSEAERNDILVMSLGDEIGLPAPNAKAASEGFAAYLKRRGIGAADVDPASGGDWSKIAYSADPADRSTQPGLYYWSKRYLYHYGILEMKKLTDVLREHLPNAHVGANFSPHHGGGEHSYLGEIFKWVTCFREDGMTLPWAEDYIWQVPVGTPQMNGLNLDLFRAGLRGRPDRKILYYVMPHAPGNTPAMWRRLFHNAVGHGARILNLFEFDPVWVAYTENHVTGRDMYAMVLRTLRELGRYEDIMQTGRVRPAQVGLWFSETGDIWHDNLPSFGAAKRALYIALLGLQLPVDCLVDQDANSEVLGRYKVLYLTDNHVSRASSEKIAAWVRNGGTLMATAGAGMLDEYDQPNAVLRDVLGVEQSARVMPPDRQVHFVKQDIAFVPPLDDVTLTQPPARMPAFGVVSRINAAVGTEVRGRFADGSPAVVANRVGKGETLTCAFLPGLAYFKPAIPLKPLDRGSSDDAMAHLIPTAFDAGAKALIGGPTSGLTRPAVCSDPLVAASIIEAEAGTIIVLENWRGTALKGMTLTVSIDIPAGGATLAGGGSVTVEKTGDTPVFTFDMDPSGDVLILR